MTARIGVIGCGWWATRAHLPALLADADAEISAIADPDDGRRERTADAFGIPRERLFAGVGEMLDAVALDGAIVAVPHHLHAEVAEPVLDRGLHLLLEKPMAIHADDAWRLHDLAAARHVELVVGYPWHYNAQVVALREQLQADRIGRIESVAAVYASIAREFYRGNPERYEHALGSPLHLPGAGTYSDVAISGGGQGVTQTTHVLALILWLTGLVPRQVAAMTQGFELDVDLVNGVVVDFEGDAIATVATTGSLLPGQAERLEVRIYGTSGHVILDLTEGSAAVIGADGSIDELPPLAVAERSPEWAPSRNLIDIILRHGPNRSPSLVGASTVELTEAMYRSAEQRASIELRRTRP